jgi:hypothetical protein
LIPDILELLKKRGAMHTVLIQDEAVKLADQKKLVYCEQEVTRALTVLKRRKLAINANHGIWSTTGEGFTHPKLTSAQAREFIVKKHDILC